MHWQQLSATIASGATTHASVSRDAACGALSIPVQEWICHKARSNRLVRDGD
jgi:hypothetical protein